MWITQTDVDKFCFLYPISLTITAYPSLSAMTPETAFQFANTLVLPQWLLMIVAPRWQVTKWLMASMLIPGLLALLYVYYLFTSGSNLDFQSFSTLAGVTALFKQGQAVLAGWIHYLAFDLVAGSWILRNGQERGVNHLLLVPCLLLCFMLGPCGLLLYLVIRSFRQTDRQVE